MAISGATLTGGVTGSTVTVDGNTFTCVASGAGSGEFTTAAGLATLIDAVSGISAANASGTITIKADAVGTAGNAITMSKTGAGLTLSGATLTGGAAALYTDAFDLPEGDDSYDCTVRVTALTAACTADFTPQGSVDGGANYDQAESEAEAGLAFTQFTAVGVDEQYVKLAKPRNRLKLVLGGTSPYMTATVTFVSRND